MSISKDEFYRLQPADETPRARKVDWSKVLNDIIGVPVRVKDIVEVAKKHKLSKSAFTLYYSEVTRFLNSVQNNNKYSVEKRKNEKGEIYYLILRKAE